MTPKEVLEFAKKNKVEVVDLKFIDLPGLWQHFSMSTNELTEELSGLMPEVYAIGDCVRPRHVLNAIWEGYRTAYLI